MALTRSPADVAALDMAEATGDPVAGTSAGRVPRLSPRTWTLIRRIAVGIYFAGLGLYIWDEGIPLDRESVVLTIGIGLAAASIGRGRSIFVRALADWLPIVAVMLLYDLSRGAADGLGRPVVIQPQIDVDRIIGFGEVPTTRLQHWFIDLHRVHWWEAITAATYVSHFVAPFAVAAFLWVRNRDRFVGYVRRFVSLSFAGVAFFFAVPTAPPWMAGDLHYLPPVARASTRGWRYLHLDVASQMLDKAQYSANLVAAFPSLHGAYPMLLTVFFWKRAKWPVRVLLVAYPLVMAFTLMVGGEHYAIDILAGWALVFAVHAGWTWWERHRSEVPREEEVALGRPVVPAGLAATSSGGSFEPVDQREGGGGGGGGAPGPP